MGAETRARANVWATASLTGALFAILIVAVSQPLLSIVYPGISCGGGVQCGANVCYSPQICVSGVCRVPNCGGIYYCSGATPVCCNNVGPCAANQVACAIINPGDDDDLGT